MSFTRSAAGRTTTPSLISRWVGEKGVLVENFSPHQVARSSKGWHCPQCIHISSTKGNLKSHILSGRHKTYTEKPFGCQYCDRSYGTKQSLQVHISTNHRAERDAEYQALSKSLGMKSFPEHNISGNFYQSMKTENFDMPSLTSLSMSPVAMAQLQQMQKVPSASQMNLVRSQLREQAAAINTNGGAGQQQQQQQQQQQRAMMPAPGLPPNLTSCRLEARQELAGTAPSKTMEIQKFAEIQNSGSSGSGNAFMEDIEAVDPPALAIERKVGFLLFLTPHACSCFFHYWKALKRCFSIVG